MQVSGIPVLVGFLRGNHSKNIALPTASAQTVSITAFYGVYTT